jgi:hypothetical protein
MNQNKSKLIKTKTKTKTKTKPIPIPIQTNERITRRKQKIIVQNIRHTIDTLRITFEYLELSELCTVRRVNIIGSALSIM